MNFILLRRRHIQAWTVVTVPALAIVATVLLISLGWAVRERRLVANRVTIVEPARGGSTALVREHFVVATGNRHTSLVISDLGPAVSMTDGRRMASERQVLEESGATALSWLFEPQEPAFFYAVGTREFGAVSAVADRLSGTLVVVNESGTDFSQAWAFDFGGGSFTTLGPIRAGSRAQTAYPLVTDSTNPVMAIDDESFAARVARSIDSPVYERPKGMMIIAVAAGNAAPPRADGRPLTLQNDITVIVIPAEER